jgi:hypothetical protein
MRRGRMGMIEYDVEGSGRGSRMVRADWLNDEADGKTFNGMVLRWEAAAKIRKRRIRSRRGKKL